MSSRTVSKKKSNLRLDIQGLRALAVVAVIFDHLMHWPAGGFVGVDVFFVISGFLITGLLLRAHEKTGTISARDFYTKRLRRIVPAATAVLIVTAIVGNILFNKARALSTVWDAIFSFFFAANWHFAAVGTDYFQATGPASPLQHYWSLSVEEQFYLVWPWLMLLTLFVAAKAVKKPDHNRIIVGVVMGIIVVASFMFAMWETATDPNFAYFSTFSRAWELGLGALLAIATPLFLKVPLPARTVTGWVGLTTIVGSMFVIDGSAAFPAPWALLPVLGALMVIAAGIGGEQKYLYPINNSVSTFLGKISYSLYLWHFPIIIFSLLLLPEQTFSVNLIIFGLTLALSIASYYFIEEPLRLSPWLGKFGSPNRKRRAWREWRARFFPQFKWAGFGLVAAFAAIILPVALLASSPTPAPIAAGLIPTASTTGSATAGTSMQTGGPEQQALGILIDAALASTDWPQLTPTIDDVIANDPIPPGIFPCGDFVPPSPDKCTFGDPNSSKEAILVGDSVAQAWIPALKGVYAQGGWHIRVMSMYGCPFADVKTKLPDDKAAACETRKANAATAIAASKPDLVIVANTYTLAELQSTGKAMYVADWQTGFQSIVERIRPDAGNVMTLSPPPAATNVQDCYTPTSKPASCVSKVTGQWSSMAAADAAVMTANQGQYVDTRLLFCSTGDLCPEFVGTTPVKRDLVHMVPTYAALITPAFLEMLIAKGLV
ncbi:acyltransferase family protein [Subtercola vilae]|uniref:Acyltransferase n=1 Tax=Subtercola vilae TaxID=2056433 RepID=A0A4T2BWG8_9MICO|nr:acyltransferase family protein [Subtercola vilae]TIH35589.1 acyltransferase [Subtercola vilae]